MSETRDAIQLCLKEQRERVGLSQRDLAAATGLDPLFIAGLERGTHVLSLTTMLKLLQPFRMTFTEFAKELDACIERVRLGEKP
jgi:transcriptional regulator with XRE-family HTH domain